MDAKADEQKMGVLLFTRNSRAEGLSSMGACKELGNTRCFSCSVGTSEAVAEV